MVSITRSRALCLLAFEGPLTFTCGVVALYIRFGAKASDVLLYQAGWAKILLAMAIVQGSFYLFDLYDIRMVRQRSVLCVRIVQAIGFASIALACAFYAAPDLMLGRGVFFFAMLLMLTAMMLWRVFAFWLLGRPQLAERVLILGTEKPAVDLAREVLERREQGYEVVGFVGDDPLLVGKSLINPCVIGLTDDLEDLVRRYDVDRIVVAVGDRRGTLPIDTLLNLRLPDEVSVEESVSFYERLTGKVSLKMLRPSWLIFSDRTQGRRFYRHVRRMIDVVLASVGFVVTLPVMALAAVAIKLDSRGPIFYTQERVGLRNRPFTIIKFRSMTVDAERDGAKWAGHSDPRTTRVGRLIRKIRVDELPQFVNVIRGDMSFIGPRPERPVFVEQLQHEIPYYSRRHLVKPGLTGWAQIKYPYGASVEDSLEKLQFDLYYIKNQSPLLDLLILFETVRLVLFGRGAR